MNMSITGQAASAEFSDAEISNLLTHVYGDIPRLRGDTPLAALGFQPGNAVFLAHQAKIAGLSTLSDSSFRAMLTVEDFAIACREDRSDGLSGSGD
jgi:hypothetical protein